MTKELAISLAVSALMTAPTSAASRTDQEKCYGVAKKGQNDCATKSHSCHAKAKQDGQKEEWVYVPKGLCNKLVGGSLQSSESAPKKN